MKNESNTGLNYKFVTYVVPHVREESYNKVKIELETGTLVNPKTETPKPTSSIFKPLTNAPISQNNVQANINTPIKQETSEKPEKQTYIPLSNKLSTNIRPNDINFNPEMKREEGYEFLSSDATFFLTKKESKNETPAIFHSNVINNDQIICSKPKIKKRKKNHPGIHCSAMADGETRTGRWTKDEHKKFIEAICKFGNEWKKVQQYIKTRSSTQARSHAQKFFLRLKKKFNLSNKDSLGSIAELNKYPEDVVISYIRECTNSDANIDTEQKVRLINVLVNFANFNKKTKRRKSKNSLGKQESMNSKLCKVDNERDNQIYYSDQQNGNIKNDYFGSNNNNIDDNNFSVNNLNNVMSEENDEEMEEESLIKTKKIFKITKIPRISDNALESKIKINRQSSSLNIPQIKTEVILNNSSVHHEKDHFSSSSESSNVSQSTQTINKNHVGVPFNIKIDNNVNKNTNVNFAEPTKVPYGQILPDANNKQNYNYINIMTINLLQPSNMINGNANKQVIAQNQQIPISALFNNISSNQDNPATQQLKKQILQHLINNNLVKTVPNIPAGNSINTAMNNSNSFNNAINQQKLMNQFQANMNNSINNQNNISQMQNSLNNNISNFNNFNNFKSNLNTVNSNSQNISTNSLYNNNGKMVINNTNSAQTTNSFLNNLNNNLNLNYLNSVNSGGQGFSSGKYDEMKNFYSKSNQPWIGVRRTGSNVAPFEGPPKMPKVTGV